MEKTFVFIKPDAVERNIIGKIISYYENASLHVVDAKMLIADVDKAIIHYEKLKDKPFFQELIDHITRSPIMAMIIEGDNAVNKVREINGNTDPKLASEGTIRHEFGISKTENTVHASDCMETAKREIALWMK